MKSFAKALIFAAAAVGATAANATVSVSAVTGSSTYSGPPITYDFSSTLPPSVSGGGIVGPGGGFNIYQPPLGASGKYYSVGPSTNSPGTIGLGSNIAGFSFLWGSIDKFNTFTLTTLGHPGGQTYTGSQIAALIGSPANGSTTLPGQNPLVTFVLTGLDQMNVSFTMSSLQNAFEIDSISVNAVPEPATWAMMLLGFGAIGFGMRRRQSNTLTQLA